MKDSIDIFFTSCHGNTIPDVNIQVPDNIKLYIPAQRGMPLVKKHLDPAIFYMDAHETKSMFLNKGILPLYNPETKEESYKEICDIILPGEMTEQMSLDFDPFFEDSLERLMKVGVYRLPFLPDSKRLLRKYFFMQDSKKKHIVDIEGPVRSILNPETRNMLYKGLKKKKNIEQVYRWAFYGSVHTIIPETKRIKLSELLQILSKVYPKEHEIDVIIFSCRNYVSPKSYLTKYVQDILLEIKAKYDKSIDNSIYSKINRWLFPVDVYPEKIIEKLQEYEWTSILKDFNNELFLEICAIVNYELPKHVKSDLNEVETNNSDHF